MVAVKRSPSLRPARSTGSTKRTDTVIVENINHPASRRTVDAGKYQAMRRALLKVLPSRSPGLTLAQAVTALLPHLPASLFPQGAHAGWWFKTVQLDLEAKHQIVREKTSPLRVRRY